MDHSFLGFTVSFQANEDKVSWLLYFLKLWPCNWLVLSLRKQNTHGYDLTGFFLEEKKKAIERDKGRGERQEGERREKIVKKKMERKVKGEGRLGRKRKNNFSRQDFHRSASCDS